MRVGVLLGGCGLYDGSDVQETVLTLLALEAAGEKPVLMAPDVAQGRTVDHLSGDASPGEERSVLRESARLARGAIRPLAAVRPGDLEALIVPGGYGPAVNFSTNFAQLGAERRLLPEVQALLRHFLEAGKPLGLVGLGEVPVRMALGLEIEMTPPSPSPEQVAIDRERRIVHTPGFAGFARLKDVRAGIEAMVREVLVLMAERLRLEAAAGQGREGA